MGREVVEGHDGLLACAELLDARVFEEGMERAVPLAGGGKLQHSLPHRSAERREESSNDGVSALHGGSVPRGHAESSEEEWGGGRGSAEGQGGGGRTR
ncbi:hypothetical protein AB1Y20_018497 [Prymnesium parvum]|uniref:Uncharacterized protein n=1 Tax=Prymnesium parvum TaxID=97485 RepID=A0AB34JS47_PRYPA